MLERPTKDTPQSLRIQTEVMLLANAIAEAQGEGQNAAILRQALGVGILVIAASLSPDEQGRLAGLEPGMLAKSLRRKLAAAVDLMQEHQQLPGLSLLTSLPQAPLLSLSDSQKPTAPPPVHLLPFDEQMGDDLEEMGIGGGLSAVS